MGYVVFFFFQAEDGIRDDLVTGVQTCALPISNRRRRASIPEVQGDDIGLLRAHSSQHLVALGDIAVRGPMKSITANVVPSVQVVRDSVQVGVLWDRMVERSVEDRDLRQIWTEYLPCRQNALDVIRVVQRR